MGRFYLHKVTTHSFNWAWCFYCTVKLVNIVRAASKMFLRLLEWVGGWEGELTWEDIPPFPSPIWDSDVVTCDDAGASDLSPLPLVCVKTGCSNALCSSYKKRVLCLDACVIFFLYSQRKCLTCGQFFSIAKKTCFSCCAMQVNLWRVTLCVGFVVIATLVQLNVHSKSVKSVLSKRGSCWPNRCKKKISQKFIVCTACSGDYVIHNYYRSEFDDLPSVHFDDCNYGCEVYSWHIHYAYTLNLMIMQVDGIEDQMAIQRSLQDPSDVGTHW